MTRKIAALIAFGILACSSQEELPRVAQNADTGGAAAAPDRREVILFLGTSLTAGYGLGAERAFPAVIQQKLDSAALPFRVVNAGLSGETSAGGLRRLDWSLQQPFGVLVLELGANDGLRGLPVAALRANLDSIITHARRRYPDVDVVLAGMEAPPNLGPAYTTQFRQAYVDLAKKHAAVLIPFVLDGVAAVPAMNQDDGIHPNAAGHERIAGTIWAALEPVLRRR